MRNARMALNVFILFSCFVCMAILKFFAAHRRHSRDFGPRKRESARKDPTDETFPPTPRTVRVLCLSAGCVNLKLFATLGAHPFAIFKGWEPATEARSNPPVL